MKKIFYKILISLQVFVLILVVGLEYFSYKKMGVARYLIFKKQEFASSIFSPTLTNIYQYGLLIFIIMNIFLLFTVTGKSNSRELLCIIGLNLLAFVFTWYVPATQLNAYHFFQIAYVTLIIFEYVKLFVKQA